MPELFYDPYGKCDAILRTHEQRIVDELATVRRELDKLNRGPEIRQLVAEIAQSAKAETE